jgi:acetyl esterase/lipase
LGTVVFSVVTPTLTAYLPDKTKATGTGVVIAPGGAFVALAIEHEGHKVARRLQERGIAAFVLKYRILEKRGEGIPKGMHMDAAARYGIADGVQARSVVRRRAAEWGVAPDRIGFMGFSAGGMVATGTLLQADAAARPNFVGILYGAPFGAMPPIPKDLPPIFMAWAQDDTLTLGPVVKFHDALMAAGNKPEVHVYSAGGHGSGMKTQDTTSDHWIDAFYYWLEAHGLTKPPSRPAGHQGVRPKRSGAEDIDPEGSRGKPEIPVVSRHRERLAHPILPHQRRREVQGVERAERGGERLGRPGENRTLEQDEVYGLEPFGSHLAP